MGTMVGLSAILMWGFLAVLSVYSSRIPPFQLLALCFSLAALLVVAKRIVTRSSLFRLPVLTPLQWLVGMTGLFGFHFCYFMAIRFAPAIEVSLIAYLWPLLLGMFVSTRQRRLSALLGGLVGFAGTVIMIIGGKDITINPAYLQGYGFAFACALIWSAYSWFLSAYESDVEDIAWLVGAGAILALICCWLFEEPNWQLLPQEWLAVLLLGLGPVGGAFYLWDIGMKKGNQSWLASLSFSTPVISSVALALFGMSSLSLTVVIAICLILIGAYICNRKAGGVAVNTESTI